MYFSVKVNGVFHIWREQSPDGTPEQLTSGTSEEEGVAIAPDGRSLYTSLGTARSAIWIHDTRGDRQLSSEGSAFATWFSQDGNKLYYLMQNGQNPGIEIWSKELSSGKGERVVSATAILPGATLEFYDVSHDGKQVAFSMKDQNGISHVWLSPTDHHSSPRQLASVTSQDTPRFLPNGDLVLRSTEGEHNFIYFTRPDGSERRQISPDPILDLHSLSPDGRWVTAFNRGTDAEHAGGVSAIPLDGGPPIRVCNTYCLPRWDLSGKFFWLFFPVTGETYMLPVNPSRGLPDFPPGGINAAADLKKDKRIVVIHQQIDSAVGSNYYSYTRQNTRRNIYRIPLPE